MGGCLQVEFLRRRFEVPDGGVGGQEDGLLGSERLRLQDRVCIRMRPAGRVVEITHEAAMSLTVSTDFTS